MPCLTPSSPRRSGSSEVGGKWATKSSAYTSAIGPTSPVFQSSCSLRRRRLWFTPSSAGKASSARRFGETRGLQAKLHDRNIEPAVVLPGDLPLDADDHEAVARVEAARRRVRGGDAGGHRGVTATSVSGGTRHRSPLRPANPPPEPDQRQADALTRARTRGRRRPSGDERVQRGLRPESRELVSDAQLQRVQVQVHGLWSRRPVHQGNQLSL